MPDQEVVLPDDLDLGFIVDGVKQKIRAVSIIGGPGPRVAPPDVPEKSWLWIDTTTGLGQVWMPSPVSSWVSLASTGGSFKGAEDYLYLGNGLPFNAGTLASGHTIVGAYAPPVDFVWPADKVLNAALTVQYLVNVRVKAPTAPGFGSLRVALKGVVSSGAGSAPIPVVNRWLYNHDTLAGAGVDQILTIDSTVIVPSPMIPPIAPGDAVHFSVNVEFDVDGAFVGCNYEMDSSILFRYHPLGG